MVPMSVKPKCSLLVFAARLSKMQFVRFRNAIFENTVYLFSRRDFRMRGCVEMHAVTKGPHFTRLKSAATKTTKSTFCCCEFWGGPQGQKNEFLVFVAALSMLREPFGKGQWNRF